MISRIVKMLFVAGLLFGIVIVAKTSIRDLSGNSIYAPSGQDIRNYAERMKMTRELMQNPDLRD